jgi:hypothetical protein
LISFSTVLVQELKEDELAQNVLFKYICAHKSEMLVHATFPLPLTPTVGADMACPFLKMYSASKLCKQALEELTVEMEVLVAGFEGKTWKPKPVVQQVEKSEEKSTANETEKKNKKQRPGQAARRL